MYARCGLYAKLRSDDRWTDFAGNPLQNLTFPQKMRGLNRYKTAFAIGPSKQNCDA
jgi:hypothetical protein